MRHLGALGVRVEEDRPHVHRGDPVDERMVGLRDVRVPRALDALHEVELPQRAIEVERLRPHVSHAVAQLIHRPGPRQRGLPDVPSQVEVGVMAHCGFVS